MYLWVRGIAGADPGFQVRGCALKEIATKMFGVIRVKNHDFTPKNHIFSNFRGRPPPPPPPWIHPCIDFCLYLRCVYWFFVWICFVSVNYHCEHPIHQYVFIIKNTQSASRQKET